MKVYKLKYELLKTKYLIFELRYLWNCYPHETVLLENRIIRIKRLIKLYGIHLPR